MKETESSPAYLLATNKNTVELKRGGAIQEIGQRENASVDVSVQPQAAVAESGKSILLVSSSGNKFSQYPSEILTAEGLNGFTTADIGAVTADMLSSYDVVILGHITLTSAQVTMFSDWTNAGGTLIAFRPDAKLAPLLGLTPGSGSLANKYLLVHTATGPGKGIVSQTMQYQGEADLYAVNGATKLATLYSSANSATTYPAVTSNSVGNLGGTAVAFTFDLAKSIIYTRQGNPEWAGQKRDGQAGPIRSDDQYYPDWVDLSKVAIPQADEQQRLLANIITLHSRKPMPRLWYLPRGLKAAVVMTGDDHGNGGTKARFNQYLQMSDDNSAAAVADWRAIRGTSYIYPGTPLTNSEAVAFEQQGFEVALHLNTNCSNYTPTSLEQNLTSQLAEFKSQYSGVAAPTTNRTHCIAWSDWHTQPKVIRPKGIRLDANYYYWPSPWVQDRPGMFTGSGIPMRFADLDGGIIDVYQLATQMTDESDQSFPYTIDQLLNKALGKEGYYGVFCANMHTDANTSDGSDAIIASAKSRNVPVISSKQLLTWLDGRNGSSFSSMAWNGGELSFTASVASGARNLQGMLPVTEATGRLLSLTVNGAPVTFRMETIKGIEYAFFPCTSGNYVAVYDIDATPNQAPVVNITSPASNEAFTSPASITITANALDNDGSVSKVDFYQGGALLGVDTNGSDGWSYTWTEVKAGAYELTAVATDDGGATTTSAAITVSVTAVCPCTVFQPNDAPTGNLNNDNSALQLGMKFRSSVNGFVTGVRFYKQSGNTGTHTGQLYSSSGALLASVVFQDETASGWQQAAFSSPVAVTAGTTYVISYHSSAGTYSATSNGFGQAILNEPLSGLQNGTDGPNGVFRYTSSPAFPNESFGAANYWVDAVFNTTAAPGNQTPTVALTSPAAGATFTAPATVTIAATAADSDGTVAKVEFFNGTAKLGEDLTSPYSFTWSGVAAGAYQITAKATDNSGLSSTSEAVAISVSGTANAAPTVAITSPANNATFDAASNITITADALDSDGTVSKVEFFQGNVPLGVDTDNSDGWSYTWDAATGGSYQLTARATDNGGATTTSEPISISVTAVCPCTVFKPADAPTNTLFDDSQGLQLGMKFRSSVNGFVTGVRFYKQSGNAGTHTGQLYSVSGALLASVVFQDETATGWQQAAFSSPVAVTAGTTYVISYHSSAGTYSATNEFFTLALNASPLSALANGEDGPNGVYAYGNTPTFPTDNNSRAANYWVDVVFDSKTPSSNQAPTVALISPANGATFTAPASITLLADASDSDGTVSKVEFFQGDIPLGEDSDGSDGWSYTWSNVTVGAYALTAKATDNKGAAASAAAVNITVNEPANTPPVVSLTAPADGATYTAPAVISLTATASDSDGTVSKVEFYEGDTKIGESTDSPYTYTWSGMSVGSYALTARATDSKGAVTISNVANIVVNAPANKPPVVAISSPTAGASFTAPASISITATASDEDGSISKVEFYNGESKIGEDTNESGGWSFTWAAVPVGSYSLTAKATDDKGAVTVSNVANITVNAPANQAPTVAISSPVANATFTAPATIAITATASDSDGSVAKVEFYNGATKLGEDATSPYSYTWTDVPLGSYQLVAKATDDKGGEAFSAPVAITVNPPANQVPVIAITSPVDGASFIAPAAISISANASDTDGTISKVEFFNGATKLGEDTNGLDGWGHNWGAVPVGTYQLTAKATDNAGAVATSTTVGVTVTAPANKEPVVTLTSPADNATFTAPASITIAATASDPDGTIAKVEFFNGTTKLNVDNASPYSFTWTNVAAGTYQIAAMATDNSGAVSTTAPVTVVVNAPANQAPIVLNPVPDQIATIGTAFSFTFAANTFSDPDSDPLTYTASLAGGGQLPAWLSFNGTTRTFSGTPPTGSPASLSIALAANDGKGGNATDNFNITINPPVVPSAQQITGFVLVSAATEQDLQPLADGATISLSALPTSKLNIRANTSPGEVGSVLFELSGAMSKTYADNLPPYALHGDNGSGNYYFGNWSPPATGTYTLKATPYSLAKGRGTAGTPMTISFTIVQEGTTPTPTQYTLNVNTSGNGTVVKSPNQTSYTSGSTVSLTASPAAGYQFVGWSGDASGTANPLSVTMTANKSITATFQAIPASGYTLTVNTVGSGTVIKNPNQATYASGSSVTLSATPASGFRFVGWRGDASGTQNPLTVMMTGNKSVTATFEAITTTGYTLTVSTVGSGTVAKSPDQSTYAAGSTVSLTASPAAGYQFAGWSGAASGTANSTTVTMDGNKAVTATFTAVSTGGAQVTGFVLVSATTEQDLQPLADGATINLSALGSPKLNIRATTSPATVGSVKFELSGAMSKTYSDNAPPYALHGDNGSGNYYFGNWSPPATGTYTLKATPYSLAKGRGTAGTPMTISFTITSNSLSRSNGNTLHKSSPGMPQADLRVYPNPFSDRANLSFSLPEAGGYSVSLYDARGFVVRNLAQGNATTGENISLDVDGANLPKGIYLVRLQTATATQTVKLILNR
ncbi:Ig-like domain-containing protein [Pontibacter roseus]|uniref:Ig-like domain-containing protein n=1 Tax=Pontibacter roseus TaxID=336989 RepID=UPI0003A2C71C|nr:Ig-like domain-containing protein [Pontibacter roseus]